MTSSLGFVKFIDSYCDEKVFAQCMLFLFSKKTIYPSLVIIKLIFFIPLRDVKTVFNPSTEIIYIFRYNNKCCQVSAKVLHFTNRHSDLASCLFTSVKNTTITL